MDEQKHNKKLKTEMGGKTTIWIFQATNYRDSTCEVLVMTKKGKPQKRE